MTHMIVETLFDPPATEEDFDANAAKLFPCLEGTGVNWVKSFVSQDRRRRICIFEAPDADTVRTAYRSAGVVFERVWAADVIEDDEE